MLYCDIPDHYKLIVKVFLILIQCPCVGELTSDTRVYAGLVYSKGSFMFFIQYVNRNYVEYDRYDKNIFPFV